MHGVTQNERKAREQNSRRRHETGQNRHQAGAVLETDKPHIHDHPVAERNREDK